MQEWIQAKLSLFPLTRGRMHSVKSNATKVDIQKRSKIHWTEKDRDQDQFILACITEVIAMMIFVILADGGALSLLNNSISANMMETAALSGFSLLVVVQFTGPLSGGHFNCAVTLALFLAGRISGQRFVCYLSSQLLGAFVGACILLVLFGTNFHGRDVLLANAWDSEKFIVIQVMIGEMLATAVLVLNVLSTVDHPGAGGGPLGVFPIAMSVVVGHLFLAPIDGCGMNPTNSFGSYLYSAMAGYQGEYHRQQYVFWLGPMLGSAIAAIVYEFGGLKLKRRQGGGNLATRLHLSEVPTRPGRALTAELVQMVVVATEQRERGEEEAEEFAAMVEEERGDFDVCAPTPGALAQHSGSHRQ